MWSNVPQKLGDILRENNKMKSPLLERKDQEEEKIQGSKNIINGTYLSY